jgi:hypothetical protein
VPLRRWFQMAKLFIAFGLLVVGVSVASAEDVKVSEVSQCITVSRTDCDVLTGVCVYHKTVICSAK